MVNISIGTDALIDAVEDRFANTSPTYGAPASMKLGVGAQTPSVGATDLTTPVPFTYTEVDDCDATTGWSASTDGSIALNTTDGENVEGTGCLNLVKSGTTTAVVGYSKTTSSVDFTGKQFWGWIYITDLTNLATTTCLEIRFGSDNTNYYYKRYDKADLIAGTNWFHFSTATATGTTGSPAVAACDYTEVRLTGTSSAATWTGTTMRMDHLQLVSTTDFELAFDSGPEVDAASDRVTSIAIATLPMAAGQPATNTGWFLSTDELYGLDQFSEDQKSQEEEWEFTESVQFQQIP